MTTHPIHTAINKPLLILGVDRRAIPAMAAGFFVPLLLGAWMKIFLFRGLRGLLVGTGLGLSVWLAARAAAERDPQFISLLLLKMKMRKRYEAGRVR